MHTWGPSRAGAALARALGILRIRRYPPTRFRPRPTDLIINWGDANLRPMSTPTLNNGFAVRRASRKVTALEIFREEGVPCPDFTTDRNQAHEWLENDITVVGRSITRGSGGRGITIYDGGFRGTLPDLPLYTKYVKKRTEYRVFVVNGRVVRVTEKRHRRGAPADYRIRNLENDWVYCSEGVVCPKPVHDAGRDAVRVLGLDFGAADVGWNVYLEQPCVYEVNTAFGLEGTTLDVIAEAFREEYGL